MRRTFVGLILAAVLASTGAAATAEATGTITVPLAIVVGAGGTGAISSPVALCDASAAAGPFSAARVSDRLGSFGDPAWAPDASALAFAAYDRGARRFAIDV